MWHVRTNGQYARCYAEVKNCPLGPERHFEHEKDAEQVSKIIMEMNHGILATQNISNEEEYRLSQLELPRNQRDSYLEELVEYDKYLYGFDKDMKRKYIRCGSKKLGKVIQEFEQNRENIGTCLGLEPQDFRKFEANIKKLKETQKYQIDFEKFQREQKWEEERKKEREREYLEKLRQEEERRKNDPDAHCNNRPSCY